MKKIEAQKQFIAELEEDIAIWMKRKSLLQSSKDKDRRAILSQKIDDAKKEIEGHNKKLAKLSTIASKKQKKRLRKKKTNTKKGLRNDLVLFTNREHPCEFVFCLVH